MAEVPPKTPAIETFDKLLAQYLKDRNQTNFDPLFKAAEVASEENYAPALSFAGGFLLRGLNGVQKDEERGVAMLEKAMEAGNVEIGLLLGEHFMKKNEHERGFSYYKKAADAKESTAKFVVAQLYELGRGVAKDEEKALEAYEDAAQGGVINAWLHMARLYEKGSEAVRDPAMARNCCEHLYNMPEIPGTETIRIEAMSMLSRYWIEGIGGPKSYNVGFQLLDELCYEGHVPSMKAMREYKKTLGAEFVQRAIDGTLEKSESAGATQTQAAPLLLTTTVKNEPKMLDESVFAELDDMIGLDDIKQQVRDLAKLAFIQQRRKEENLPPLPQTMHTIFTGNPGTGKTEVARVLGNIMQKIGVLQKGHVTEVDKAKLVKGYIGQTETNTLEILEKANGGILLVDEAYALARSGNDDKDFGRVALDTIMKYAEDHRDTLMVVFTGYRREMEIAMSSNPGLNSRFPNRFDFADYKGSELEQIFDRFSSKMNMTLAPEAREEIHNLFDKMSAKEITDFANGRGVRTLFEQATLAQSRRLYDEGKWSRDDMTTLTGKDIKVAFEKREILKPKSENENKGQGFIGFIDPKNPPKGYKPRNLNA